MPSLVEIGPVDENVKSLQKDRQMNGQTTDARQSEKLVSLKHFKCIPFTSDAIVLIHQLIV